MSFERKNVEKNYLQVYKEKRLSILQGKNRGFYTLNYNVLSTKNKRGIENEKEKIYVIQYNVNCRQYVGKHEC